MKNLKKMYFAFVLAMTVGITFMPLQAKALDKAMVSFTFDDGYSKVYTLALPALKRRLFPATAYIITDNVGLGYAVTWSQIWDLYWNNGWEIGSHGKRHVLLTDLECTNDDVNNDEDTVIKEIREARSAFQMHGIINVTALAYPYGYFEGATNVVDCIKNDGTLYSGRTTKRISAGHFTNQTADFDPWRLNTVAMDQASSAYINQLIATTIAEKSWIVFMMHDVVSGTPQAYQTSITELTKVIEYVYQNRAKIDVVTVSKGVAKLLNSKAPAVNLTSRSLNTLPPPSILIGQ